MNEENIKILLLEGVHEEAVKNLKLRGYENVEYHKKALEENKLIEKIKDVHYIGIRSKTRLSKKILKQAENLIAIGAFCIGTNQIDLDYAKERGIPVFNAPFANTRSVAELIISEIIMLMRGIPEKNALAHRGVWQKSAEHSQEVRGKTLGIIGYGHIGSQVSVLAESLGVNVCYYDIVDILSIGNATKCSSLEELLKISDIITLHVPATDLTKNMISARELETMKPGSYIINASRGNVVDVAALAESLKKKHIYGAALDVFPEEPSSVNEEFVSELREFDNVLITPHIGGSTEEAQINIAREIIDKLVKYNEIGTTMGAVNFVEVTLPADGFKTRFIHIHKNLPGVMSEINNVFANRGLNIASQYLQSDQDIGYVILNVDNIVKETLTNIVADLNNVKHTIRTRFLDNN